MAFPLPDRDSIRRFVEAVFKRADPDGYVCLRAFGDGKGSTFAAQAWRGIPLSSGTDTLVDAAFTLAKMSAEATYSVVFCPPAATFRDGGGAGEQNIKNGLVLIIECDKRPTWAVKTLLDLLGSPTIIVASGGLWENPDTGLTEEKLHAYWRLSSPTRTQEEHDLLAEARRLAAVYVGADPTSGPICHPIRWPGSWHRKAEPRLTRIEEISDNEINLIEALGKLRTALPASRNEDKKQDYNDDEPADIEDIKTALAYIPNEDRGWDEWNAVGMAIWKATAGADEGMVLFDSWSAKSAKYDRSAVVERWRHFWRSPPTKTGASKLFAAAIRVNPRWKPSKASKKSSEFRLGRRGTIISDDLLNVKSGLDRLNTKLSYNSFADQMIYINGTSGGNLTDSLVDDIWFKFEQDLGFRPSPSYFRSALNNLSRVNSFNPVQDYLTSLPWDGIHRLDTWLIDLAGAPDNEYVRAVSSLILIAAVARVYDPGCKFDEMLVLESPKQGTEKSTALRALTGRDEWFTDGLELGSRSKEVMEQISGKWIIEASDLSGMRRSDVESMKQFLSKQSDRARLAYGHMASERPRTCVFFGTTNSTRYLRDELNRRFWPVRIIQFDLPSLIILRDKLWAEARARYEGGASIRLSPSLYALAEFEQESRRIDDQWVDDLAEIFGGHSGSVVISDIFNSLGILNAMNRGQNENQRIGEAMRQLGWEREKRRVHQEIRWCYVKGSTIAARSAVLYVYRDPITGSVSVSNNPSPTDKDIEPIREYDNEVPF